MSALPKNYIQRRMDLQSVSPLSVEVASMESQQVSGAEGRRIMGQEWRLKSRKEGKRAEQQGEFADIELESGQNLPPCHVYLLVS
ncbi:predicted protein [Sclerotinia sclerotiorum 1980 UF-70]|uniref:Uncharacterized protein n=1 Tax=Sclerotinia sclerotiorum (strain ATCC 18683 / 1980 / Ss-1) TaxID=665079 RepID=A7E460_SCLS1|nr:predicted protein [Sclerotinia sclerotiorum 1980 UF-70]EDN90682.1 predicted protein [Sclerotinia sclerotiorum 1980 UF-70]